jgi:monoamine oxidase
VTGFAGTARGADVLAAEAAMRLERAAPEVMAAGPPLVVHWGRDPLARGCYSALRPGDRALLPLLSRPWGGVVFAGEHVNGSGTIEGAIASGIEAANRIVAPS